jgi:hypothetical protein
VDDAEEVTGIMAMTTEFTCDAQMCSELKVYRYCAEHEPLASVYDLRNFIPRPDIEMQ